jgi:hypothetical protein
MVLSARANIYAGWCYCCGDAVGGQAGFLFDPSLYDKRANSKLQVICKDCNTRPAVYIGPKAAPRQRPLGNVTPSLNDI